MESTQSETPEGPFQSERGFELGPRLGLRDSALRGPEGRDTRYGDTLGGSRGCKRIMASPRQDIPGRPDSTGESAPAPVATAVASTQRTVVSGAPASDEFRQ